jgi:heat-inducible transcriptional repressor
MELTQRQKIIFKVIVEQFTYTAEPIGSKTLKDLLDFPISSATIRNEMAVLEKAGLLEKTHTSSGRVPSQSGYRYYVENLMETSLEAPMASSLAQAFSERHYTLDEIVQKSCEILSDMTHLTTVVLGPDATHQKLKHIQLIPIDAQNAVAIIITDTGHTENKVFNFKTNVSVDDIKNCTDLLNDQLAGTPMDQVVAKMEDLQPLMAAKIVRHEVLFEAFVTAFMRFATEKVAVSGRSNMLYQPEFSDLNRLKKLMKVLENSDMFRAWTGKEGNIAIPIGTRNELIQIDDCSVVTSRFKYNKDEEGQLMVVGPNRMQYSKVVGLVDSMARMLEHSFSSDTGGLDDEQEERK